MHKTLSVKGLLKIAAIVAASDTPPPRTKITNDTGLSQAVVSKAVQDLIELGVLKELRPVMGPFKRPVIPLGPGRKFKIWTAKFPEWPNILGWRKLIDASGQDEETLMAEAIEFLRQKYIRP